MSRGAPRSTSYLFRWPLALGLATIVGLVLGLTGEGPRDFAAWTLVGLAPFVIVAALLRRNPSSPHQKD